MNVALCYCVFIDDRVLYMCVWVTVLPKGKNEPLANEMDGMQPFKPVLLRSQLARVLGINCVQLLCGFACFWCGNSFLRCYESEYRNAWWSRFEQQQHIYIHIYIYIYIYETCVGNESAAGLCIACFPCNNLMRKICSSSQGLHAHVMCLVVYWGFVYMSACVWGCLSQGQETLADEIYGWHPSKPVL
jgi:hypothetical protein